MNIIINIEKLEINVNEKQELELEKLIKFVNDGIGKAVSEVKDTTETNINQNIPTIPKESLANIIREIATKAAYKELYGEEMEDIAKVDLTKVPTCELSKELEKREGVETIYVEPYEKKTIEVEGPMIIHKNID